MLMYRAQHRLNVDYVSVQSGAIILNVWEDCHILFVPRFSQGNDLEQCGPQGLVSVSLLKFLKQE